MSSSPGPTTRQTETARTELTGRALAGSRLRALRLDRGIAQADLARAAGISASYLNLIEHNRRRIGGRLLNRLAGILGVEAARLAEGASGMLIDGLAAAAAGDPGTTAEVARVADFAEAFPGWATLAVRQSDRISALEDRIAALSDRLGHDPQLARSLHEVISSVTAIRSTASILVGSGPSTGAGAVEDTPGLDPDWQARFHRNIHGDSLRLAEASRSLAAYLDPGERRSPVGPAETFGAFLDARGHHVAELEGDAPVGTVDTVAAALPDLVDRRARRLAAAWLGRYRADAAALPLAVFERAARGCDYDPAALADRFGAPLAQILRRLGALPPGAGHPQIGLAIVDAAGGILQLKAIAGFTVPRSGPGCPIWPLYQALTQPARPLRALVEVAGHHAPRFLVHAVAEAEGPALFDGPHLVRSVMAVRGDPPAATAGAPALAAGIACRTCPRRGCPARREPSILPGDAV